MNVFVSDVCPAFWDDFVSSNSPLLFHRSIWAEILRNGYGQTPLYCWLEKDNRPVLGLLGGVANYKIARLFFAALPYGGLIGNLSFVEEFFRLLEPKLKNKKIHQIRLIETESHSELETIQFKKIGVSRHIVDLKGHTTETLFDSIKRTVRKNIRKSRKEGVVVKEAKDTSEIDEVYRLYLKTMAHNKAAAKYPIGRFLSIYNILVPKRLGVILVAKHKGKIIGSNTLVSSEDMVHDMQLSYDHAYQRLRPNDALVFASLEWTLNQGMKLFDFMGSPQGDTSLEKFKAKWLAERTETATYVKDLDFLHCLFWKFAQNIVSRPLGAKISRILRRE